MKNFIIIAIIAILCGCSGMNCIKVGGSYEGAQGNLEYCWDSAKSEAASAPVLVSPSGESATIITESQAEKIIESTQNTQDNPKVSTQSKESAIARIYRIIRGK